MEFVERATTWREKSILAHFLKYLQEPLTLHIVTFISVCLYYKRLAPATPLSSQTVAFIVALETLLFCSSMHSGYLLALALVVLSYCVEGKEVVWCTEADDCQRHSEGAIEKDREAPTASPTECKFLI